MAFKQYAQLFWYCIKYRPDLVYVPAGQTTVGYTCDAGIHSDCKNYSEEKYLHTFEADISSTGIMKSGKTMKAFIRFVHRKVNGQIVLGNNLRKLFNWIVPGKSIFM
ncbi:MAG: hypothetical protein R2847_01485 [Bacteroidia bacterium]